MLNIIFKHSLTSLIITLSFLWPQIVFSANPPTPISPSDNSTESNSLKLSWEYSGECITTGSCFVVEVDNNSDFSSTEKSTYTNSLNYSPQGLAENTWHWRVKAKDTSGIWSDWSKVFKFTISGQAPTPSINPQTSQTSPTSQKSEKQESNFSIKDAPSEINSNQEFEVAVSLLLPNNKDQSFYLKGAFKTSDSSNYFGETSVDGWIKNGAKYSEQLKIKTDSEGKWEGKIKFKPDGEDSGFKGTGNYILKVGRYSESGSGPTWSNELTVKINAVEIAKNKETEKIAQAEAPEEEEEIDLSESIVKDPPKSFEISKLDADAFKIASVAGVTAMSNNTTSESDTKILDERKVNWLLIILGVLISVSGAVFVYFKFRKEKLSAKSFN